VRALTDAIQQLRAQVQGLSMQVSELQTQQQDSKKQVDDLRRQLARAEAAVQGLGPSAANSTVPSHVQAQAQDSPASSFPSYSGAAPAPDASASATFPSSPLQDNAAAGPRTQQGAIEQIEENQSLIDAKVTEQAQTKVESGSKYRLRLSGMLLMNVYDNRGFVDSQDVPEIALPASSVDSSTGFGGSLRQSQISLEGFGPDIAGAHVSANVKFDFAGGFPQTPNGTAFGIMRLRTGTFRMDWTNTSIVAGQDYLFFSPLSPTSLANTAVPALSYAGNLWGWIPQVRIEHRIAVAGSSTLSLVGGILDSFSGDVPGFLPTSSYDRYPTWGEQSGQPAYAGRIAWSRPAFGQMFGLGVGGYFGPQTWGFSRNVNAWAATFDLNLPLGKVFDLSGSFYRGNALAGLGGAIGQDVLMSGPLTSAGTVVQGIDSMGGWVQLKFKPKENFEINGALGDDNPFASELRRFPGSPTYYGELLSKNISPFVNFIYEVRSNVLLSAEYRRLKTFELDDNAYTANHTILSLGYIF
jgi:hypothetical protein